MVWKFNLLILTLILLGAFFVEFVVYKSDKPNYLIRCVAIPVTAFLILVQAYGLLPSMVFVWGVLFLLGLIILRFPLGEGIGHDEKNLVLLDVLAIGSRRGKPIESIIVELSKYPKHGFGKWLEKLAEKLESGLSFPQALKKVKNPLPRMLVELLSLASATGDVEGILPACRRWYDQKHRTDRRGYGFILYPLVPMFLLMLIASFFTVFILPRLYRIGNELCCGFDGELTFAYLVKNSKLLLATFVIPCIVIFIVVDLFTHRHALSKIKTMRRFYSLFQFHLFPGGRQRLLSQLAFNLSLLLDAGLPEERALLLAGEATTNTEIFNMAALGALELSKGAKLPDVLTKFFDKKGEFAWRYRNVKTDKQTRFSDSVRNWCSWLDAVGERNERVFYAVAGGVCIAIMAWPVVVISVAMVQMMVASIESITIW